MISGRNGKINVLPDAPVRRDTGPYIPSLKEDLQAPAPVSVNKPSYEGDMLKRELAAQKEIARKKKCVAPLHKSSYIYITEGINPAGLGRKNEVL